MQVLKQAGGTWYLWRSDILQQLSFAGGGHFCCFCQHNVIFWLFPRSAVQLRFVWLWQFYPPWKTCVLSWSLMSTGSFFFFYIKLGFESKFSVGFFLFNVSAVTPERDILDKLSTAFPLRLHCRHTVSVLQQPEQFFFIAYPFLYSLTKFAQTLCQV